MNREERIYSVTMTEEELRMDLISAIKDVHPEYNCVITIDRDYY